jgi:serine/threonine protein kinase
MGRAEAANVEGERARPGRIIRLGKYQLLAVLGRGGMAEVFLALSRGAMGFDKLTVVKRLRDGLADDDNFRNMFLDEARLAARLNHPNVVHTYEVGEHDGVYFIAMEYLEGQALNKIVREAEKREQVIEPAVSARIISDALAGLHHAHTLTDFDGRPLNIIHRDVSPHNLFVTYEGTTKVVDFGIAKAALSSNETEVGVVKGKVAYMSPEQATGAPIDARSDVFAMGIVLWEMLTQRRLMTGDSAASTIHRLLTAQVPAVSSLRRVAPDLDSIVERALERDPNRRFPSALAMREALEDYLVHSGEAVRQDEIGQRVTAMFVDIRDAIKRQIRAHVEGAGREPLPHQPETDTGTGSGSRANELPMLGGSGSGIPSSGDSHVAARSGAPPVVSGTMVSGSAMPAVSGPAPSVAVVSARAKSGRVLGIGLLFAVLMAGSAGAAIYLTRRPPAPIADVIPIAADVPPPNVPPPNLGASASAATTPAPSVSPPVSTVPSVAPPGTAVAVNTGKPTPASPSRGTHSTTKATVAAPPPPAPDTLGYLTFDTYPWTRVSEGATQLGTTPLVHLALPAGAHTLTLDNPDQSIHQTYSVTIKAGDSITKRLGLK